MAEAAWLRLLQRVGHALQAEHALVERHRPVGDVADGEDGRVGGARLLVDDDAAGGLEARRPGRSRRWGSAPTPTRAASQAMVRPSASRTPVTCPSSPSNASTWRASSKVTPARLVIVGEEGREGVAGHPRQDARLALDHHRLGARAPARRRRPPARCSRRRPPPAACPARAPPSASRRRRPSAGTCTPARSAPGDRQRAGARAGGEDQRVVGQGLAVGEGHGLGRRGRWRRRSAPRRRSMSCSA